MVYVISPVSRHEFDQVTTKITRFAWDTELVTMKRLPNAIKVNFHERLETLALNRLSRLLGKEVLPFDQDPPNWEYRNSPEQD